MQQTNHNKALFIFTPKEYGSALSVGGIVGGLISLGAGVVITRLSGLLSYAVLMLSACAVSMMLIPNKYLFLGVFALVCLGRTLVDYSVPSILRSAVPVHLAGPFNAWRMLLHNGGSLLATTIAAFIPVTRLLALTVFCQLLSGLHYFISRELRADQQIQ